MAFVEAALDAIGNTNLDGVTLDIKLMGEMADPVADALAARQIPFVFITGYDAGVVPARHVNVSRVEKRFTPDVALRGLQRVLAARSILPDDLNSPATRQLPPNTR